MHSHLRTKSLTEKKSLISTYLKHIATHYCLQSKILNVIIKIKKKQETHLFKLSTEANVHNSNNKL